MTKEGVRLIYWQGIFTRTQAIFKLMTSFRMPESEAIEFLGP